MVKDFLKEKNLDFFSKIACHTQLLFRALTSNLPVAGLRFYCEILSQKKMQFRRRNIYAGSWDTSISHYIQLEFAMKPGRKKGQT